MRFVFTSKGIEDERGFELVAKALHKEGDKSGKTIFLLPPPERDSVKEKLFQAAISLGFKESDITVFSECVELKECYDYVYITAGNTFEILQYMRDNSLCEPIRNWVLQGATYIGASAGALIAGRDIEFAYDLRDKNFIGMTEYAGLDLLDGGVVVPHRNRKQLGTFLELCSPELVARYKTIYCVSDERSLLLEI